MNELIHKKTYQSVFKIKHFIRPCTLLNQTHDFELQNRY